MWAQNEQFVVQYEKSERLSVKWGGRANEEVDSLVSKYPDLATGRRMGITIRNTSDSPILAFVIRWKWRASDGKPRVHDVRTESFFLNQAPVLRPQQLMIVLPGLFSVEFDGGFGMGGLPLQDALRQFEGASEIVASVDCVIFRDGLLLGPDESGMVESLLARRKVANELGRIVLNSISLEQDPVSAASRYARDSIGNGSRSEQLWRQRLAQMIGSSSRTSPSAGPEKDTEALKRYESLARQLMDLPLLPELRR